MSFFIRKKKKKGGREIDRKIVRKERCKILEFRVKKKKKPLKTCHILA